jgi:hypothetical protein
MSDLQLAVQEVPVQCRINPDSYQARLQHCAHLPAATSSTYTTCRKPGAISTTELTEHNRAQLQP